MTDNPDRTARTLTDLLAFTAMAERLVQRGRGAYDTDETLRLAAEAILHKLGEAVSRLPERFIDEHPAVPWRAMRATRNIVAHQHEQVDYYIIWNALAHRLPKHVDQIRSLLADRGTGQ